MSGFAWLEAKWSPTSISGDHSAGLLWMMWLVFARDSGRARMTFGDA
jgi:hypothetical protein